MTESVQVPSTKGQGTKVLGDGAQEASCRRHSQCYVWRIGSFGVVGCFQLDEVNIRSVMDEDGG